MVDIFLANTSEDYAERLEMQGLAGVQAAHEMDLSNRSLLYGGGRKIVVLPTNVDAAWVRNTCSSIGYSDLTILIPSNTSLRLCRSIERDGVLLERLASILRSNPSSRLIPYAVTKEYCSLCRALELSDPSVSHAAAIQMDSKAEFRMAFQDTAVRMPRGYVCEELSQVVTRLMEFSEVGTPAVLKVHDGESGWGMEIFDWLAQADKRDKRQIDKAVKEIVSADLVWSHGPYIVEEYIVPSSKLSALSPSGEGTVSSSGTSLDYICDQVIAADGTFIGIRMGRSIQELPLTSVVAERTIQVGQRLQEMGYEGSYDVDFIVGDEGLYALESNVRRTGGTHVYEVAKHCFGDDWTSRSFISNDSISYGEHSLNGDEIYRRLGDILFDAAEGSGIIVSYISSRRPMIGVIGVGKNDHEAIGFLQRVSELLRH
ncbi:hypothetical protein ABMC88_17530 [Sulfitobacter sp. HNIBRBA2951]|uniref:preATP grasp domain-containing protein n=1 Tax=Sulfitobacter aquimarinus TaxID=3158557 RepID=UPI0032DEC91D